nr:hypothetical protein HUO10_003307 [Paraburkholderia busanensis]
MKFCKDCKHYRPVVATILFAIPDQCHAGEQRRDPVNGYRIPLGSPSDLRMEGGKCGVEGKLFEPATLDGRLAMLEEK